MKDNFLLLLLVLLTFNTKAQVAQISLVEKDGQMKLVVDDADFMINGMNWDYFPIGTNYEYSLWEQPKRVIKAALKVEMTALQNMGVNAIRQYNKIPPQWIKYIYKKYGIYTMLNHPFGRYGLSVDGEWMANTDYADPRVEKVLLAEVADMVEQYKGTPGLLMYLLGNENNYGLSWEGAETEDIPKEDEETAQRAAFMYKAFNKAALVIKAADGSLPVAICNGDLVFIELVAEFCPDFDIYGTNMYRGVSFGDAFQSVKDELKMPILFTEFGADAFNTVKKIEEQKPQAYYMVGNWKEIYENAAGLGKAGNALGGFTFQFTDGWWKFGQTKNLEVHDDNASWSNGGYQEDFAEEGFNNMNEEWFGICAKGETNKKGVYQIHPRAAYYALKEVHQYQAFQKNASLESIQKHFDQISIETALKQAKGSMKK